jgi:CHASE2 domain-containing sensor protein
VPAVFISYRREDSAPQAGRLYDRLVGEFGARQVFRDLDKIAAGQDFVQVIDAKLAEADVVLVVIGRSWSGCKDTQGRRRLDDPEDFVRREVLAALNSHAHTLPVLVDAARMPGAGDMPAEFAALTRINACELLETRYEDDVTRLIEQLKAYGAKRVPLSLASRMLELRQRMRLSRAATAVTITTALLVFFFAWMKLFDFLTLDTRIESFSIALAQLAGGAPVLSPDIKIVAINDATERELGKRFDRSWRREHAILLDRLSAAGAKVVAFDLFLSEPSASDQALTAAARRATKAGTQVYFGAGQNAAASSVQELTTATSGQALLCIGHRMGYASVTPLAVQGATTRSSLALLAARLAPAAAIAAEHREVLLTSGANVERVEYSYTQRVERPSPGCAELRKGDVVANMFISLSPLAPIRSAAVSVPYESVLQMQAGTSLAKQFQGATVLVGLNKAERDLFLVRGGEERFGVELHADAINSLKQGLVFRSAGLSAQFLLMLVMAGLGAAIAFSLREVSATKRMLALGSAMAGYFAACVIAAARFYLLWNVLYHVVALLLAYAAVRYLTRRWSI